VGRRRIGREVKVRKEYFEFPSHYARGNKGDFWDKANYPESKRREGMIERTKRKRADRRRKWMVMASSARKVAKETGTHPL